MNNKINNMGANIHNHNDNINMQHNTSLDTMHVDNNPAYPHRSRHHKTSIRTHTNTIYIQQHHTTTNNDITALSYTILTYVT